MHVRRLDELVVAADGQRLGVGQGLLESAGELVHAHGITASGGSVGFVGTNGSPFKGLQP